MRIPVTLRYRLTLIYGLAALLIFGLVFLINYLVLNSSFASYVEQAQVRIGNRVANTLSVLYEMNESDDSVQRIMHSMLRGRVHSIRLLDASGKTVFYVSRHDHPRLRRTHRRFRRSMLPEMRFRRQFGDMPPEPPRRHRPRLDRIDFPFRFPDRREGKIRIGFYRWQRMMNTVERYYLNRMGTVFIVSAIGAILLFSLIAFLIARSLSRPLERVAAAARLVPDGHLKTNLKPEGVREIRELGESFNFMAGALGEREELQKRMTSDIAHELRTPVTILKSHLEGISEGVIEMDSTAALSLLEETERLERIINDLRTIWELEKTGGEPIFGSCDLSALLRESGERIGRLAEKSGGGLVLEIEDGVTVTTDSERVMRAVNNLLVNAIKHAGSAGEIRLVLKRVDGEVVAEVTDSGPGIPEEDLPHIFERFYRTDNSRYRETGGAGLGLAIAREAVRSVGGRIAVRNNEGDGCTFTITLPQGPQKGSL